MSESAPPAIPRTGLLLLLAAILVAAACAIIYELLIGTTSSYFLGDSVEQFSLTIGFFLFAMGLGSWGSRLIARDLLARLVALEIWLGLLGGSTVAILYLAYVFTPHFRYWMLVLTMAIGVLIGLEVPLLTRILRGYGSLRTILANVLSLDYLGALLAALLFPYVLMPALGSLHTAALAGLLNVLAGASILICFRHQLRPRSRRWLAAQVGVVTLALAGLLAAAGPLLRQWEDALYAGRIVHSEQSPYQRIVLTQWRGSIRLFLDGHLQFAAVDQHRYHESLVHPAMALTPNRERILIIGGGDGLAAREVLRYPDVRQIDLVDIDPAVTALGRRNVYVTDLNDNALNDERVRVRNEDGFIYLQREHVPYGVIIMDLPDPREEALAKLYSVASYRLCRRHLSPGGLLVTQATSPYFAREAYWSIAATLEAAGLRVLSYHAYVPSFGEWGFHLAGREAPSPDVLRFEVPLRFLDPALFRNMLRFDPDMARLEVAPNRLDRPLLAHYYREGWKE